MSDANTQTLLAQLEPMCHQDRMRFMVDYGKNPDLDALKQLERGNIYERQLALMTCHSSQDAARVERGLGDPSRVVRALAVGLAPVVLSDAQLVEALRILPRGLGLVLLNGLRKHKRAGVVADLLLEEGVGTGHTREATTLLGFASSATVQKHLPLMEMATPSEWRRLARTQPDLVAGWLEEKAQTKTEFDARLFWQVQAVLSRIAEFSPDRMLSLLQSVPRNIPLASWWLEPLLERWPQHIATLALESDETPYLDFSSVAHRLELEQLLALFQKHPSTLSNLQNRLARFVPTTRAELFRACRAAWADSNGMIAAHTLRLLPRALRESEAQRHLEHPFLATRPLWRVPYAALFGWDEAKVMLEPSFKHPKPEQRLAAVPAFISTARFETETYDQALEFVALRKNEQDPIRGAMLAALADLPPSHWRADQLERLGQILQDALNAADLSNQTVAFAERLVIGMLPFQLEWAAQWIGTLVKERGQMNWFGIGMRISNEQAQRVAQALLSTVKTWQTREREVHIVGLFHGFGQQMRVLPDFLELAEQLVKTSQNDYVSPNALGLIAQHDKPRLRRLVPELLQLDPSWATIHTVYHYLHRHRQDLLTPFLGRTAYKGRFSTGKTRFVLPLEGGFQRWNPLQQSTFVQTLEEVALDSERDIPAILRVIRQLTQIPNASATLLELLAGVGNTRLAVRDAALRALGRLDEARGLEPLLEALDDARARVAIYALRYVLLAMPQQAALELLKRAPLERVTVAKEVVRLIGELHTENAHTYLLELSAQPAKPLHRDVRVALLRALWDYLEDDRTWEVLVAAAEDEDSAIADGVIRLPTDRLSAVSQEKLVTVMAALVVHPDPDVRLETLRHLISLPVTDTQKHLVQPLLDALNSKFPEQISTASQAFFATYAGSDHALIQRAFQNLIADRKALDLATRAFLSSQVYSLVKQQGRANSGAQAILAALETDPYTLHLQTEIVFLWLPWQGVAEFMISLENRSQLNPDVYHIARTVLEAASQQRSNPLSGMQTLERAWREHPSETLRRLALEALILSSTHTAWRLESLERLQKYRSDPSSMVSAAAQFTFPTLTLEP